METLSPAEIPTSWMCTILSWQQHREHVLSLITLDPELGKVCLISSGPENKSSRTPSAVTMGSLVRLHP